MTFLGIPHPLDKFSSDGQSVEDDGVRRCYAALILQALKDVITCPHLMLGREAHYFLFEDEELFPAYCRLAGIDGKKFRAHLWKWQRNNQYSQYRQVLPDLPS